MNKFCHFKRTSHTNLCAPDDLNFHLLANLLLNSHLISAKQSLCLEHL